MFCVKFVVFATALLFGSIEINAQCECNVQVVCPTNLPPNQWKYWVFPCNAQKVAANQNLFQNNQGWAWAEAADYSMCGPPPPQGYVCTIRSALLQSPPQRICDFNGKVANNLQAYRSATLNGARSYTVWMEAPYACNF